MADPSRTFRRSAQNWLGQVDPAIEVLEIGAAKELDAALPGMTAAPWLIDPLLLAATTPLTQACLRQQHAGLVWRSAEPPGRGNPPSTRLAFHLPRPRTPQRLAEQWRYLMALAEEDLLEAGTVGEILGLAPARAAAYLAAFNTETLRCLAELEAGIAEQSPLRIAAARHALSGCAAAMGARALARHGIGHDKIALASLHATHRRTLDVLALAGRAYGVEPPD